MFTMVTIPKEYQEYLDLLLSKGYAGNDTGVVLRLIEDGLLQVLMAIKQGGLGDPEPQIEYYKHCETNLFAIPEEFRGFSKIGPLSKLLKTEEKFTIACKYSVNPWGF